MNNDLKEQVSRLEPRLVSRSFIVSDEGHLLEQSQMNVRATAGKDDPRNRGSCRSSLGKLYDRRLQTAEGALCIT